MGVILLFMRNGPVMLSNVMLHCFGAVSTLSLMLWFSQVLVIHSPTYVTGGLVTESSFVVVLCIFIVWLTQFISYCDSRSARRAVTSHLGCHHQHASSPAVWGRSPVMKSSLHHHLHRTAMQAPSTGKHCHRPQCHLHQDHFHYIFQGCQPHSQ